MAIRPPYAQLARALFPPPFFLSLILYSLSLFMLPFKQDKKGVRSDYPQRNLNENTVLVGRLRGKVFTVNKQFFKF